MSLSSISMLAPNMGLWERFEYSHVIMNRTIVRIEAFVNTLRDFEARNSEAVAFYTNLNTVAVALAFISCAILSSMPEVATIETLFSYGVLSFLYLSYLAMVMPDIVVEAWLIPNITYVVSCVVFTVFRRLLLSRLGRFPGPKTWAVSNYSMAREIGSGSFPKTVKALHKKHKAKVVRTGPNELSVNDPEVIVKLYGENYKRGSIYEGGFLKNSFSIKDTRSTYHHPIWRRIWDGAFTTADLKNYSSLIETAISRLVKVLKRKSGADTDVTAAINDFAIDLSADVTFGEDAGMQDGSGDKNLMKSIEKYTTWFGFYGSLRNVAQILSYLYEPAIVKDFRLRNERLLVKRQKRGGNAFDITFNLMETDEKTGRKFQVPRQLAANTSLSMMMGVATGTTITQTIRTLAKETDVQKKLQAELDAHWKSGGDWSVESVKNLPYLNGIVNEALRLHNPLPLGTHAIVPDGGIAMGSYKLPSQAQVFVPTYAMMTDDQYFPRGEEFIPERWTEEKPELVADKRAFIPWGYGSRSCPGKQLALNEMRATIAKLFREFEVELGESYDDKKWNEEWKGGAMVTVGECMLSFKSRKL